MNPWPDARWGVADKPVLVLDGVVHRIRQLAGAVSGEAAYVVGADQRAFERVCRSLDVRSLFYEMRVVDLTPLERLSGLQDLAILWSTKLADISPLERLQGLQALVIENVPRVSDLSPLCALSRLRFLEFSGGVWSKNRVSTLAPLTALPSLAELVLLNLAVAEGGLRPLADCRALRSLTVSNQFPTEDYAFLSGRLPNVECSMFAPFVELPQPLDGKDVMVTGKGKPLLSRTRDRTRLDRYVAAFEVLRSKHADERGRSD